MKQILLLIVFLAFFGILIGANIYLPRRFAVFFGFESTWWLYILSAAITLFMIAGVMGFSNSLGAAGHVAYVVAAFLMGFMLYILIATLMMDLLNLFVKIKPMMNGLLVIGLATAVSLYGTWNAFSLKVYQRDIPLEGISTKIRAMHLSDIHLGHFRGKAFLQRIVDETNRQNTDVVFLTGDLFDGRIHLNEETLEPLKQVRAPIYFVEGNHDGYSGVETIKQLLRKSNVHVLEDEVVRWKDIQVIGLNHMRADRESPDMHAVNGKATMKDVLDSLNIDPLKPSILLHHSPDGIQYAAGKGIDLYLSGHTHAGQLFPINYINDLIFKYNKGLHQFNGTRIYVSQGAGTFGPPMRVGTHSELTVIDLLPVND